MTHPFSSEVGIEAISCQRNETHFEWVHSEWIQCYILFSSIPFEIFGTNQYNLITSESVESLCHVSKFRMMTSLCFVRFSKSSALKILIIYLSMHLPYVHWFSTKNKQQAIGRNTATKFQNWQMSTSKLEIWRLKCDYFII